MLGFLVRTAVRTAIESGREAPRGGPPSAGPSGPSTPSAAPFVLLAIVGACLLSAGGLSVGGNLHRAITASGGAAREGWTGLLAAFALCVAPGVLLGAVGVWQTIRTRARAAETVPAHRATEQQRAAARAWQPERPGQPPSHEPW